MKKSKKKTIKPIKPETFTKSVKKPGKKSKAAAIGVLILGLALIPGSIFLNSFIQDEIDSQINNQILVPSLLESNYYTFLTNKYPGAPPEFYSYYMWNLTNPDEFMSGTEKPIYMEIGPFVFRAWSYKFDHYSDALFNEITYREYIDYVQVDGENISEVYITNLNPAFVGGIALAGGSERNYLQMQLPYVLTQVKDTFQTIYTDTINDLVGNDTWIKDTQTELLKDAKPLGISVPIYEYYNITTADIFFSTINTSVLKTFVRNGLPEWETAFYAEWANDSYAQFGGNFSYLLDNINWTASDMPETMDPGTKAMLGDSAENLTAQALSDDGVRAAQNALIGKKNAEMLDDSGSASGVGIDIEFGLSGIAGPPEADLNITNTIFIETGRYIKNFTRTVGETYSGLQMNYSQFDEIGRTGIIYDQCKALWNENDPFSLTGMDYLENPIWIDALLDGSKGSVARANLMAYFGITSFQLQKILAWINYSISNWMPNAVSFQTSQWNSGPIISRTVEEWLFEANDTAIYNFMNATGGDTSMSRVNFFEDIETEQEAREVGIKPITIYSGLYSQELANQIVKYDGKSTIDLWQQPEKVMGSLGMYNSPGTTGIVPPKIFNPDLMRVIDMVYVGKTSIYGVELNRFTFAPSTFAPNEKYYMNTQGLINAQPIERFKGAPVLVSKPHFLDADPSVITSVEGVNPDRMMHETFIDVEPISGATMNARQRIQVNFNLTSDEFFTSDINSTVMPSVWYERSGIVPQHLASKFTDELYPAQTAQTYILTGGIALGVVCAIAGGSSSLNKQVKTSIIKKRTTPKSKKALKANMDSIKSKLGYTVDSKKFKRKNSIKKRKQKE
ncbi:MAG: hypothetical protein BAJALOKI1v1_40021 [Promethearchaeota archaeon]|nr:MAG: hypothetical protein BAJALOKI1v1_40021 [Candidatus Lokiarchaeota archaeon]